MFGIKEIGTYIPEERRDNRQFIEKFGFASDFLDTKIGVKSVSLKAENQETSDLAVLAFQALEQKLGSEFDRNSIGCVVLVTQNPDGNGLPHTSAIVHGKLGLPKTCFAFDVSLGCSGFVAGLAIIKGFMTTAGIKTGVLITADPYSKIVDLEDRNTVLLFGDAATASLIVDDGATWSIGEFDLGTLGEHYTALHVTPENKLVMNGRTVFDFSVSNVPASVAKTLAANGLTQDEVEYGIFHPGSKYIVDSISKRLNFPNVARGVELYGNTVSSSIPLLLEPVDPTAVKTVLVCGFGVGLGWATTILRSTK